MVAGKVTFFPHFALKSSRPVFTMCGEPCNRNSYIINHREKKKVPGSAYERKLRLSQREKKDTGIDLWMKVRLSPHKKRRYRLTYEGKIRLSKRKKRRHLEQPTDEKLDCLREKRI